MAVITDDLKLRAAAFVGCDPADAKLDDPGYLARLLRADAEVRRINRGLALAYARRELVWRPRRGARPPQPRREGRRHQRQRPARRGPRSRARSPGRQGDDEPHHDRDLAARRRS
jgi:hypothetical protein